MEIVIAPGRRILGIFEVQSIIDDSRPTSDGPPSSTKSDSDKYITLIELYSSFKDWYKEGFPGRQIPNKNEISEYFTKIWGEPMIGMKWKGYRLKTLQDDIDNGDAVLLEDDDLVDYDRPDSLI